MLLLDDEDRENEGDIIYAVESLTTAQMALMIRECSGIVCLCLTETQADRLALPPMVVNNNSANQTAFTVSIEAKHGVTTGVSAQDRVTTIKTAANHKQSRKIWRVPAMYSHCVLVRVGYWRVVAILKVRLI